MSYQVGTKQICQVHSHTGPEFEIAKRIEGRYHQFRNLGQKRMLDRDYQEVLKRREG